MHKEYGASQSARSPTRTTEQLQLNFVWDDLVCNSKQKSVSSNLVCNSKQKAVSSNLVCNSKQKALSSNLVCNSKQKDVSSNFSHCEVRTHSFLYR
jgi:hypothetical protein